MKLSLREGIILLALLIIALVATESAHATYQQWDYRNFTNGTIGVRAEYLTNTKDKMSNNVIAQADIWADGTNQQNTWMSFARPGKVPYHVNRTILYAQPTPGNYLACDYSIYGSSNSNGNMSSGTWTLLGTITGNTHPNSTANLSNSNTYVWYLINITKWPCAGTGGANGYAVSEVALYGNDDPFPVTTLLLNNKVNGSSWPANVTFTNVTGTLTFSYFNITATGFCVTYTGNGTGTNCTTNSGTSTFFNVTNSTLVTSSGSVITGTYQALLNISATQLFTNNTITGFNVSNNLAVNTTTGTSLIIPANNGSNTITLNHSGNYSKSQSCTATSFTTTACVITGIYDNLYTIGAKTAGGVSINDFTVNVTNTTLNSTGSLYSTSTTNGSIVFPLLQGYSYLFFLNASGYATNIANNATLAANASTNLYNFTLYSTNTFNLTFRNETTNTLLNNTNITVQLISDAYANNYTTSNGTLEVTLLTPSDYTIRYWHDADVPRDYYVTLTNQSYHTIALYVLDEDISSLYLPVIKDQNGRAVSDATVKLLRYYILTTNTGEYSIVEMAKTDTNGQAVIRVVPNTINYKLIVTKDSNSLTTTPTKFTASTNTYTINTQTSPLTSITGIESVTQSLTYNSGTSTFVFTWDDDNNLVSSGCLEVTKTNTTITTVMDECTDGSTGSLIYTITDTNQTQYTAQSQIHTNTEYSTYSDVVSVDFRTKYQTWGSIGLFLTLIVFLVFSFMGAGSTETTVLYGAGAIFLMGAFGVIFGNYQAIIGILIIVGIIVYKTRT